LAETSGLPESSIEHLLNRYGSEIHELLDLVAQRPELGEPIEGGGDYLGVEAQYAASHEAALHLEDVLTRRTHVSFETADRGVRAAEPVAALVGEVLGWDEATRAAEVDMYRKRVAAERDSQSEPDDVSADAVRKVIRDPRLVAGS
jgi:glycerol-3-phosphate dehydrogenase